MLVHPNCSGLMHHGGARICMVVVRTTAPGTPSSAARSRLRRECAARRRPGVLPAGSRPADRSLALPPDYAQELRGQPPFDVTMMVTLLVYAYSVGVCSSRRVAAACERNLAFRAVSVTIRLSSAPSAISARSTWRRFGPCSSRCCAGWRDGYGQAWKPVHRRDEDGSERRAAQGDELRLHEQGNPAAGS